MMKTLTRFLLIVCLVLKTLSENEDQFKDPNEAAERISFQNAEVPSTPEKLTPSAEPLTTDTEVEYKNIGAAAGRSIASNYEVKEQEQEEHIEDHHAEFKKRAKPLKNIFMGIYKNYKSTYLGNRTSFDYKQRLRDRLTASMGGDLSLPAFAESTAKPENLAASHEVEEEAQERDEISLENVEEMDIADELDLTESSQSYTASMEEQFSEPAESTTEKKPLKPKSSKKRRKHKPSRKTKTRLPTIISPPAGGDDPLTYAADNEYRYTVGPGLNLSLDMSNEIVNVKLDGLALRELFAGRWLSDDTEQGRGKKYDMISKVLPLFILPFLIQSAIIPFLVTKLKLLLMKSILVGKLAIFLLIISAFKNSNKNLQTYEVAPSYWAGEPSRRSELAAAASSAPYSGYRVEGKPAAWIN